MTSFIGLNNDLLVGQQLYSQTVSQPIVRLERFSLPLGAWDGLRYFIVALPEPSI